MPVYEYMCQQCETMFERKQGFHEPAVSACPSCGAEVRRVYRPVGIIFKGSGFYITDSRPKPKDEAPASTPDASSTGAAKSGGATDAA